MINWEILRQEEANIDQYIFNFVLMNIIFLLCYIFRNDRKDRTISWLLVLIFCLFAYWDTDFFSFRQDFFSPNFNDFRDPLYYYLSFAAFKSYTIFRLLIWGTGLLLFKKTIERFSISKNIAIYIFVLFFLLTFSYARVSLGMAMFFYGASLLLNPSKDHRSLSIIAGLLFIACSYWGHRSMSLLILLTPMLMVKLNKKTSILLILAGVTFSSLAAILLSKLAGGEIILSGELSDVGDAASHYAANESTIDYNWKFMLIKNLRNYSFMVLILYFIWKMTLSKDSYRIMPYIKRLTALCCTILIIAISFMNVLGLGAEVIGYRYLYMLGIPSCIILSYLVDNGITKPATAFILLMPAILYAEGFIFGKILSF